MVKAKRKPKQLGQILLEQGLLTQDQLDRALEEHRNTPKSLGRVLIDLGYIRERDLVRALAEQVGLEFVDLTEYRIDAAATTLLPEALCRRYRALPIGERDGKLLVAMSDPANVYALDDIRTITGRDVQPVVATANDVEQAIQKFSRMGDQVEALASEAAEALDAEADLADVEAALEDAPIVKLVTAIMTQAGGRPRLRRAHRADGEGRPRPVPRGRRAPRGHALAEEHPERPDQPPEGHGRPEHRREARAAGRPHEHAREQQAASTCVSRRCRPSTARRSSSGSWTRANALHAALGARASSRTRSSATSGRSASRTARSWSPGPTGSGKSTTLYATLNIVNQRRPTHHHGRGPGRVPARRREPDPGEPEGRAHVRVRAAIDPARRPRHHPDR